MARPPARPKSVATLNHERDTRPNIPTAEMADLAAMQEEQQPLAPLNFSRARLLEEGEQRDRDPDLDPQIVWNGAKITLTKDQIEHLQQTGTIEIGEAQLVWRGKDRQDWSDLIVQAPMIHVQEKVHPKAIIDDLVRRSKQARDDTSDAPDLFGDFNGLTDPMARTEFYQHPQHWSNRMILGDSLQVMASLAEREALKGKVQAIYFDPPYGIKFNSNWQVSTANRTVGDKQADLSREPEQVKAFRDTWKDGVHSYLTYLRDRLTVMRELLTESGSIFVQISDENVHRLRALMDEVFGDTNFLAEIVVQKTGGFASDHLTGVYDLVIVYGRNKKSAKFRPLYVPKAASKSGMSNYGLVEVSPGYERPSSAEEKADPTSLQIGSRFFGVHAVTSGGGSKLDQPFEFRGQTYNLKPGDNWKASYPGGMHRLAKANRLGGSAKRIGYRRYFDDFPVVEISNLWTDTRGEMDIIYTVQTSTKIVERCLLLATDPGDLVLDPTCGSGTTAYVAEQWGRRWITIDTSRVALALARARLMAARYPWYLLADSPEGRRKEAEITGKPPSDGSGYGDVRQGFVYERVPHVTLKSIANNAEIDVIWEQWQARLEPLRIELNQAVGNDWQEWEIPRAADPAWGANAATVHKQWWEARIARQKEIDSSIARAADVEFLYDKPYADPTRVRVAGPFTVESLSPHRIVPADDELIHLVEAVEGRAKSRGPLSDSETDFATMILDHLRTAGVHQVERGDRIEFTSITPWPGEYIAAEGRFMEGETERRAAIFIGPEFGTVSRVQLTAAAREAAESRFDVLIATAFSFDAHASELSRLGPLPVLKAKMNPDLHMAGDLKNTGKGNLFTIFGEPDIEIIDQPDGRVVVKVLGVDIYDPNTGDVRSNDVKGIAAWFIDTAYNEESFFVRHAYFLGANDPYKQLKASLKAEIDEEAWASLYSDTSRPFERPESGRIAVKVINHFGDEVMKVFGV
ncbi:site-specific DNA-methyltransferase [Sphingomonas sp. NSE70-1]|uniref:site-specific DNA-methyltransferase (adenine-specific) n=1 Tax=Sphingomonas caseinilyticus TaxID=2908205 RepID=A0ABT0RTH4_9SPHN|nr:DNA methyltransferase [Sphingomonas caseinilyticus]MCL6698287.1 site-specific DNA-methyltransferase [Sphingomonas caseinilyticus]